MTMASCNDLADHHIAGHARRSKRCGFGKVGTEGDGAGLSVEESLDRAVILASDRILAELAGKLVHAVVRHPELGILLRLFFGRSVSWYSMYCFCGTLK